ncbi:MAG TPA: XRE family transcriptional regulator [Chloroflexi bacterium]|nr:XRE family transcriptional regulator [Chloroflexota bacterium]
MHGAADFGAVLRYLRKRAGLTQGALAAKAGCSVALISALESGQRRPTAALVRTQLAPALATAGDARLLDRLLALAAPDVAAAHDATVGVLLGRDAEIDALAQRLMTHPGRLLTLVGPPGVGKTSLAQAIVRVLTPFHADGAYTVWLGDLSGAEFASAAIASALHLVEDSRPPAVRLSEQLRRREALLFLDNFDNLVGTQTALVADLLKVCPRLRILVTSRSRLKLRAEQSIQVQPLDRRSAVELFIVRVRNHQPDYTPTPVQQEVIGELCRQLDDLPLAIELIAAHAEEMTAEELLAHVRTDRLALLGKRAASLSPDQRTLTAALQHGYALLTPTEQHALRQLSVFDGGAALDGVAALGIDLPVVQALADKSLVRLESVGEVRRVRMLETVREYATMLLTAAGEFDDAQQRRLAWCVALAEQAAPLLHSAAQTHWLQRLEAERHNFYTAIHFSITQRDIASAIRIVVALRHFFVARSHLAEIAPWLDSIELEAGRLESDPGLWARFLNCKGTIAFYRAQYDLASACFLAALTPAGAAADRREFAYASDGLGVLSANRGDLHAARLFSQTSLEQATMVGDDWLAGIALINLGEIARMEGDLDAAAAHYRGSLERLQRVGDPHFIAVAEINLGQVHLLQGEHAQAEAVLRPALATGLQTESAQVVASALEKLADALVGRDVAAAGRLFGIAQGVRRASGVTVQPVDQEDHARLAAQLQQASAPTKVLPVGAIGSRLDWRAICNAIEAIPMSGAILHGEHLEIVCRH